VPATKGFPQDKPEGVNRRRDTRNAE